MSRRSPPSPDSAQPSSGKSRSNERRNTSREASRPKDDSELLNNLERSRRLLAAVIHALARRTADANSRDPTGERHETAAADASLKGPLSPKERQDQYRRRQAEKGWFRSRFDEPVELKGKLDLFLEAYKHLCTGADGRAVVAELAVKFLTECNELAKRFVGDGGYVNGRSPPLPRADESHSAAAAVFIANQHREEIRSLQHELESAMRAATDERARRMASEDYAERLQVQLDGMGERAARAEEVVVAFGEHVERLQNRLRAVTLVAALQAHGHESELDALKATFRNEAAAAATSYQVAIGRLQEELRRECDDGVARERRLDALTTSFQASAGGVKRVEEAIQTLLAECVAARAGANAFSTVPTVTVAQTLPANEVESLPARLHGVETRLRCYIDELLQVLRFHRDRSVDLERRLTASKGLNEQFRRGGGDRKRRGAAWRAS